MKHYFNFLSFREVVTYGETEEYYNIAVERAKNDGYTVCENPAFLIKTKNN